jgi:hypothetical protein
MFATQSGLRTHSARTIYPPIANLEVRLGEHQLSSITETSLTITLDLAAIVKHPAYNEPQNDIALLKLSTKVDTNIYTPVCLPYQGADFTGLTATVLG